MCMKCMKLFGYICSPLCRARAEAQKIEIPVFEGQSTRVEARYWRVMGTLGSAAAVVIAVAVGFWIWYSWIASMPHQAFSVHFGDTGYAGKSRLAGTDQIVFLHGGTLARYDIKSGNKVWSRELITKQQIDEAASLANEHQATPASGMRVSPMLITIEVARMMESALELHVSGQNIWVKSPGELTRYDWNSGNVVQTISLGERAGVFVAANGDFLLMGKSANGQALITHINPATGESNTEEIGLPGQNMVAVMAPVEGAAGPAMTGLPLTPGAGATGPMDPAKVAEQMQNMTLAGRYALPALLGQSMEQERVIQELNDENKPRTGASPANRPKTAQTEGGSYALIPSEDGYVEVSVKLQESHIVTREAMKGPSGPSALNGNLTTANTTAAANDILNEMQRNNGGDTVQEDESVYHVSIRRPDSTGAADWTGQVTGPPEFYALKTVNVLAAGKAIIVFDKSNKKLWQAGLTYNVGPRRDPTLGAGPCVEQGDTLYVVDQAVLTAFDLATGNARWRLPSVGIVGLFFDDQGNLYLNTTTADLESIQYSRQIDITQKIDDILMKIDPKTGRTLWTSKPGGFISYVSGKFIYTVQSYDPGDVESPSGVTFPPYLKLRRINPSNGEVLWDHEEDGAPLDVHFNNNIIQVVFKNRVEVLKFLSL